VALQSTKFELVSLNLETAKALLIFDFTPCGARKAAGPHQERQERS
jgi:hypothetical protein